MKRPHGATTFLDGPAWEGSQPIKSPGPETPGLRGQLSALFQCEGVGERHSAIQTPREGQLFHPISTALPNRPKDHNRRGSNITCRPRCWKDAECASENALSQRRLYEAGACRFRRIPARYSDVMPAGIPI